MVQEEDIFGLLHPEDGDTTFETSGTTSPRPRIYILETLKRQVVFSLVFRSFGSSALRVSAIL